MMTAPLKTNVANPRLRVGFVLARHFTLSAFALFVDALRLAGDIGDRSQRVDCDWVVLGSGQQSLSSAGIEITQAADFNTRQRFDYIVVVGGLLDRGSTLCREAQGFLLRHATTTPLIGLCTGSFILAELGLMAGRTACISWFHATDFAKRFPDVQLCSDKLFVIDGPRITCSGGAGAADLAAHLIEQHIGQGASRKSLEILQINGRRQADAPQAHAPLGLIARDQRLRRALLIMEQNLELPLAIAKIARMSSISTRQLERLSHEEAGASPQEIYRRIRLGVAATLVQQTRRSLTDIAGETGFSQPSHFARAFRAWFGQTPSAMRKCGTADERSALAAKSATRQSGLPAFSVAAGTQHAAAING
jgi:transcriptional regulator GlxA family with amidase domain